MAAIRLRAPLSWPSRFRAVPLGLFVRAAPLMPTDHLSKEIIDLDLINGIAASGAELVHVLR